MQNSESKAISETAPRVGKNPLDVAAAVINLTLLAVFLITLLLFMLVRGGPWPPRMVYGMVISAAIYFVYTVFYSLRLLRGQPSAEAGLLRTMRTGARVIVLIMVSTLDMVWAVLLRTLLQTTSAVAIFMCFLVNLGIGAALLRWFAYKTNTSFLEVLGAGVLARGAPAATPTYGTQDPASSARERR